MGIHAPEPDFAIQARYQGSRLQHWTEGELEAWLGLVINQLGLMQL